MQPPLLLFGGDKRVDGITYPGSVPHYRYRRLLRYLKSPMRADCPGRFPIQRAIIGSASVDPIAKSSDLLVGKLGALEWHAGLNLVLYAFIEGAFPGVA